MRILITGGAGFIGSHLAEKLLSRSNEVIVVDDLSTGSLDHLRACFESSRFQFHRDSIFNRALVDRLVRDVDAVFHLAASVGVRRIVESPVETIETNVHGAGIVLSAAARHGTRTILASTSEVYGKSTKLPFCESDDIVLGPTMHSRWAYACSKAIDEFLALAFAREMALPVTIVRLFNTVGPRQTGRYGMVVPTIVQQALANKPITVFGTGEQTRCFGHVADIVEALETILDNPDVTDGETYNLGNTEEISINALAERIRRATHSRSQIVHVPYDQAYAPGFEDMQRRVPDITKAHNAFGFAPKRSLDAIIADVVEFTRAQMDDAQLPSSLAVARAANTSFDSSNRWSAE